MSCCKQQGGRMLHSRCAEVIYDLSLPVRWLKLPIKSSHAFKRY